MKKQSLLDSMIKIAKKGFKLCVKTGSSSTPYWCGYYYALLTYKQLSKEREREEDMSNVYYHPKHFGLEIVQKLDEQDLSDEFNMLVVWKKINSGKLFYAQDSGCSCPSPFEDYTSIDLLKSITETSLESFETSVKNFPATYDEKTKLINKVRELL